MIAKRKSKLAKAVSKLANSESYLANSISNVAKGISKLAKTNSKLIYINSQITLSIGLYAMEISHAYSADSAFSFSRVDNIPQAANISSPRDRRMVAVTPLLVR